MSSAHRPTWDPAAARGDNRHVSKNFSARQMPAHTKLKFRAPAQGLVVDPVARDNDEGARRDLKRELDEAERKSRNKRRKEQGLEPEEEQPQEQERQAPVSERRRLIEQAVGLDRDADASDDEARGAKDKGKGRDTSAAPQDGSDDSDSDSDSSDDEDDTAALLRELEKIKQERAEEKARQEKERAETQQSQREDDIALGNPLLNLENAMKGSAAAQAASAGGGGGSLEFGVKRRWDEDVIFKNQAQGNEQSGKRGFVNDLTRSDFHRALLRRFIR